jgi:ABC-type transport system involved in cytochrome c biogenesis permease component
MNRILVIRVIQNILVMPLPAPLLITTLVSYRKASANHFTPSLRMLIICL